MPTLLLARERGPGRAVRAADRRPRRTTRCESLVDHAVNTLQIRRFGIVYPDDAYGRSYMTRFRDAAQPRRRHGGEDQRLPRPARRASRPQAAAVKAWVEQRRRAGALHSRWRRHRRPRSPWPRAAVAPQITLLGTESWNQPDVIAAAGRRIDGARVRRQLLRRLAEPASSSPTAFAPSTATSRAATRRRRTTPACWCARPSPTAPARAARWCRRCASSPARRAAPASATAAAQQPRPARGARRTRRHGAMTTGQHRLRYARAGEACPEPVEGRRRAGEPRGSFDRRLTGRCALPRRPPHDRVVTDLDTGAYATRSYRHGEPDRTRRRNRRRRGGDDRARRGDRQRICSASARGRFRQLIGRVELALAVPARRRSTGAYPRCRGRPSPPSPRRSPTSSRRSTPCPTSSRSPASSTTPPCFALVFGAAEADLRRYCEWRGIDRGRRTSKRRRRFRGVTGGR